MKKNVHVKALAFGDFFFLKPAFRNKLLVLLPLLLCCRTLLNAQCTGSQTIHANNLGTTQIGQYILANCTGVLTNFTYETVDMAGTSATVTVRSGIGCSGTILGTQTISQVIGVNSVNFSPGIAVTNGQYYSIIIVTSSSTGMKANRTGTYSTGGMLWWTDCQVYAASGDWDMVFSYTATCTAPTVYSVTGPGAICPSASANIGLSGSQSGHTYQLQRNGTNTGSPVNGTGSALTFQAAQTGTYTVVATSPAGSGCTALMSGSVLFGDTVPPTITCAGPVTVNTTAGQCTGTTTLVSPSTSDNCPTGNALHFDGSNDVVRVPDNNLLDLNFPLTIETWFYPTNVSLFTILVDKRTANDNNLGYGIWLNNAKPAFYLDNNGNAAGGHVHHVSPNAVSTNTWHHMAAVYDGARVKIYVDGVLTYDQPETSAITPTSERLSIGDRNQGGQAFAGRLDEVRIWNVARTQSQIQTNMNVELNAQAGLVAVYHFNEGAAGNPNGAVTTAPDASGNNLNGTLNNFQLSGPTSNWTSGYLNSTPRLTNNAPATYPKGSTVVTWTATDFNGNTATCQQTVTVTDNAPPTITCAAPVTVNTTAGQCTGTTTLTYPTLTDNCNELFLKNAINSDGVDDYVMAPFSGAGLSQVTVEFWFKKENTTDSGIFQWSGSVSSNSPWILLHDLGSNITLYVNGGNRITSIALNVNTWYHVAITYDGSTWRMYINGNLSGSYTGGIGSNARTNVYFGNGYPTYWKGTIDEARIWSTARTQTQIQSNMRPELIGDESNLVAYWRFNQGNPGGNNSGLTTATATVGTNGTLNNFALNGPVSNWVGQGDITNNAPATYPKGITTVLWTVTDASGNTNTCQQTVTVVDNQAPTLTNPGNQAMNVIASTCAANYTIADPVSDNCTGSTWGYTLTGATTATVTGIPDGTSSGVRSFNKGITTVVLSATDGTNSAVTVSFTVTVSDDQLPTITCPNGSPFTRSTDAGVCTYTVQGAEFNPSAFDDNCPGASITNSVNNLDSLAGANLPKGPNTITWTVTDATGLNSASCQISVTVNDDQLPTITCPGGSPFTRYTDEGACTYTVQGAEFAPLTFDDNCPGASITNSFNTLDSLAGANLPKGSNTITWTIKDANGVDSASCQISVTVVDNQLPTITCPNGSPFTRYTDAGACTYTVQGAEFAPLSFNDNCPGASITNSFNNLDSLAGANLPKGPNTITWTVTDATGVNMASCQISVTVNDNQLPTITCPSGSPFTRNTDAGACTYTVQGAEFAPLTFDDNCPGASITNSFNNLDSLAGAGLPKGPNTITWTVTDATGVNMASCQISVTVNENQSPTVSCPVNQTVPPGSNNPCSATVGGIDATYADNCNGAALTFALSGATEGSGNGQASGQTFLYGVTIVTYTVTDSANLTSSCAFTVTVAPVNLVFSGKIRWENDGVSGVNNAAVNLTGAATGSDLSDTNGDYSISKPATTGNFTLKPTKTANKLNGLTAADAAAIQQHVANVVLLPAPYKRIAADVNKSNTITSLDVTLINQALLGNGPALAQITSWRFVDAAYTFPNPNVPWGFPEQINLTGVVCDQTDKDFIGIKLGDVASVWANPANFAGPGGARLVLRAQDRVLQAGQTVVTEFRADELNDLTALQFALQFDPSALHLDSVEILGGLPLTMENFGLYQVAGGEIRVVWSREKSVSLSEASPLFRLRFTALESGVRLSEALKLDAAEDTELPARVYNSALAESGVELQYWEATGTIDPGTTGALLLQNRPNPFSTTTTIGFVLPKACDATLRVFDGNGRLLREHSAYYARGEHFIPFDFSAEGVSGMLYYELITPWGVLAKKMVLVGK